MGYFFALLPPFLDSTINYLDKFLLSKYNISYQVLTVYSGFIAFCFGILVLLFYGFTPESFQTSVSLILSGVLGVYTVFFYFKALTVQEASRVASLFQLVPVFVLFFSFIFLHEVLLPQQYIGAGLIIVSAFLLSLSKSKSRFRLNISFLYMVLACLCSALVVVFFKLGVMHAGLWQAIPYEALGNGIGAFSLLFVKNNRTELTSNIKQTRKIFLLLTVSEIVYRLSRYSLYFALTLLSASTVSVLQGLQPLFLVILSIILSLWFPDIIKEYIDKRTVGLKLFAVILILSGLYLLFF